MDIKTGAKTTVKNDMDILPQVKVKEDRKDAREVEVFRKLKAAKSSIEQRDSVPDLVRNVEAEKRKIKIDLENFRAKAEKRKSDLLGEIIALEKKRDRVMEPFYQIKFDAQEMMRVAESYERRIKQEAKELNAKRVELEERERWIKEREEALLKKQ